MPIEIIATEVISRWLDEGLKYNEIEVRFGDMPERVYKKIREKVEMILVCLDNIQPIE